MLLIFLFSLVCSHNIIQNPSFEEVDSNNKALFWNLAEGAELSSVSHSGRKSLHWNTMEKTLINYQFIKIDKNLQYEVCVHFKLINIHGDGFQFYIESKNKTEGFYESSYSKKFNGTNDWMKACHLTKIFKKPNNDSDRYFVGFYTHSQKESGGEVFIDDISVNRIYFRIGINNDRDEVFDNLNVVYQINENSDDYNLNDFDLITRIKDNNIKLIYEKKINITSLFFIDPINIENLDLKLYNYYEVESIIKNKKENFTDISSYTFKKIKKIERNVSFDQYGRMLLNDQLFFPFGIYLTSVKESDLILINKTHLNVILPYDQINKNVMDMIYTKQQGKIKVIYSVNSIFDLDSDKCSDLNEEENYKKFIQKINEFKDHPALLSWYINDELPYCLNKNLRNRTLSIHELDPNHPSYTVLYIPKEVNQLMNTTDIMGIDSYPIGRSPIRSVYDSNEETYNNILKVKPMIPVV